MRVLKLKCKSFRNLGEVEIIPCEETNVICGENAQGKTNLLEAIWLFTGAKSFRTNKDADFLQFSKQKATLELNFLSEGIENEAEITITDKRRVKFNQNKLSSASGMAGKFTDKSQISFIANGNNNDIDRLQPGIYIINGEKKVVINKK